MTHRFHHAGTLSSDQLPSIADIPFKLVSLDKARSLKHVTPERNAVAVVLEGLAYHAKDARDGTRQIIEFFVPGDWIGIAAMITNVPPEAIIAAARCQIALISRTDVEPLLATATTAHAFWQSELDYAGSSRRMVGHLGKKNSRMRVAYLLSSLHSRLQECNEPELAKSPIPITQDQIGAAVGVTCVHVNRVVNDLSTQGLIGLNQPGIMIHDSRALRAIGNFSPLQLIQ